MFYVEANSFPDGVLEAHQKLHTLIPYSENRKYFGISNPDKSGTFICRAAAEELIDKEVETLVLKKGNYKSFVIKNYHKEISDIGNAFNTLLSTKNIDPLGYCVEWYLNDNDVQCMARLAN